MLYGTFPGARAPVSRLVLGGLIFSTDQPEHTAALLDAFVAAGGTALDTAHSYGHGDSERGLGVWLRARGRHDDLFVITKGAHPVSDGLPRVNPVAINSDLIESVDRLGISAIDLYLLHRDDVSVPVGPIMECLNEHLAAGRVRAIGASNWTGDRIAEANAYAAAHGLIGFTASSPNLALAVPKEPMWPGCLSIAGDAEAQAWYRANRLPIFAWSSQASGFFSGRFAPDILDDPHVARVYYDDANWARLARVREVAQSRGATPTQIALAWVLSHDLRPFALIGPRTLAELHDSLGAVDVTLSEDEVRYLAG